MSGLDITGYKSLSQPRSFSGKAEKEQEEEEAAERNTLEELEHVINQPLNVSDLPILPNHQCHRHYQFSCDS